MYGPQELCDLLIGKRGDSFMCFPTGEPLKLATKIQEHLALWTRIVQKIENGPPGSIFYPYDFGCPDCQAHLGMMFFTDGRWHLYYDDAAFAAKALDFVQAMAADHEWLIEVCTTTKLWFKRREES